jgi:hypothetical protein
MYYFQNSVSFEHFLDRLGQAIRILMILPENNAEFYMLKRMGSSGFSTIW